MSSLLEVSEILIPRSGVAHLQVCSPSAGLFAAAMALKRGRCHRVVVNFEMIGINENFASESPEVRKERLSNASLTVPRHDIKNHGCILSKYTRKYLHYPNLLIYLCNPITHNLLIFLYFLESLLRFPRFPRPQLILPPHRNIFWSEVTIQILQHDFDDITTHEVDDHETSHHELEFRAEGHELQLFVDLRDELG